MSATLSILLLLLYMTCSDHFNDKYMIEFGYTLTSFSAVTKRKSHSRYFSISLNNFTVLHVP